MTVGGAAGTSPAQASMRSRSAAPAAAAAPTTPPATPTPAAAGARSGGTSSLARDVALEIKATRASPDLALLTGKWDELVTRVRASGKALLAAALEASAPMAITRNGTFTIALDEPNDFHAKAIEQANSDVLSILGEWFEGISEVRVRREEVSIEPGERPKRVTDEMVKAERLNTLRRKAPTLDAAIDVLDLEIAD